MNLTSKISVTGQCQCCGYSTHYIDGELTENGSIIGLYGIQWTHKNLNHPANLIVALIADGNVHGIDGKFSIVLQYDFPSNSFMVQNHDEHPFGQKNNDLGVPLNRIDVVGKPVSHLLFQNLDFIWCNDVELHKSFNLVGKEKLHK